MPWIGNNFQRANGANGWANDAQNLIGIEAGRHDNQDNDFATGIDQCLTKDGSNSATTDLNMGGNKVANVAAGTAAAPAICAGNDINTGIFSPGADEIGIATNGTEKIRIKSDGKVGIGITNPTEALQVNGGNILANASKLMTNRSNAASATTSGCVDLQIDGSTQAQIGTGGSGTMTLYTGSVERMRITSAGNVGIGATAPSAPLTVVGSSNPLLLAPNNAATWSQTNLHIRNSGLSDGSPNSVYMGVTGTQFNGVAFIDTNPAVGSAAATPLAIYTAGVERMRIASSGEIGMNAAPATGSTLFIKAPGTSGSTWAVRTENSSAQGLFSVDGAGNIYTGGAASSPNNNTTGSAANLYVGPTGILQKSTSSERYKTDIRPYTHGLAEVALLAPKFYKGINDGDIQFAGLIAEDVHDAGLTEFVVYNEDNEPDALHYGNMVALAFKAIQELNAKVEALEARIAELEA